jgi:hypothetical protein
VRPIHPESITEPETFSDEVWRMMRRKIRSRGHDLAPAHDLGGLV